MNEILQYAITSAAFFELSRERNQKEFIITTEDELSPAEANELGLGYPYYLVQITGEEPDELVTWQGASDRDSLVATIQDT